MACKDRCTVDLAALDQAWGQLLPSTSSLVAMRDEMLRAIAERWRLPAEMVQPVPGVPFAQSDDPKPDHVIGDNP